MNEKTIDKIKALLSELLPENNMNISFNIPGGSDKPEKLKEKIKYKYSIYE